MWFFFRALHHAKVVIADLVAEAARAAVDDGRDLVELETEHARGFRVENFRDVESTPRIRRRAPLSSFTLA